MKKYSYSILIVIVLLIGAAYVYLKNRPAADPPRQSEQSTQNQMTFFLTGSNPGNGAGFGGLEGADRHCQTLADAAGSGNRTWRAYLSASATENSAAVDALNRIGAGPWKNFNGIEIASNVEELHRNNNINKQTALTETGQIVNGRGDTPNRHDILTGSDPDGRAIAGDADTTCGNWTKSGEGSAMLGHHDRMGLDDSEAARSWNSSHLSRGCSLENLASTGGGGLIYCFATD